MKTTLKYLSQQAADQLYDSIGDNLDRYKTGDFIELADGGGKSIELSNQLDLEPLKSLVMEKTPEAEITNSLIVWNVFNELQPSLACENRLWTRLCHIECLEYSRFRWLNLESTDSEELASSVMKHFFANTQTKYRDDNAISRLWWNAYIAKLALPDNQEQAMRTILKSADIRNNFIERTRTVSRPVIAAGVVKIMMTNSWVTDKEGNFREFMKTLNRHGGGKVFELWPVDKVDNFMEQCCELSQLSIQTKTRP
jgi:hypothetical protein